MSMEDYYRKRANNSLPEEFFFKHENGVRYHMYKQFNCRTLDELPGNSPLNASERHKVVRLVDFVEVYHYGQECKPAFTPASDFIRSGHASMVEHQGTLFWMLETCISHLQGKEVPVTKMDEIHETIESVKKILERERTLPLLTAPLFLYDDRAKLEHQATLKAMLAKVTAHFKEGLEKDYYCDKDRDIATIIGEVDNLTESVELLLFDRDAKTDE